MVSQPNCASCLKWLFRIETSYDDGSVVVNWSHPDGSGKCMGPLKEMLTPPDFGCNQYAAGGPISERHHKEGAPWHNYKVGPCPDCKHPLCGFPDCKNPNCPGSEHCLGLGSKPGFMDAIGVKSDVDGRCCGTGQVRYYDDGFIGDNKTKRHPKEKELGLRHDDPTPTCDSCHKSIDPAWMACPFCGHRLHQDLQRERLPI